MILKSTNEIVTTGLKVLVYGQAGAGKTTLIKTLPDPIILSAESGLLSLRNANLPYVEVTNVKDLQEIFAWLTGSAEGQQYKSVALDSISEIAEVVLSEEKALTKDGRQAFGNTQDRVTALIRDFRDLPGRHVYFSAKVEKQLNEMGQLLHSPAMPGQKLAQALPYFFDEVFALRVSTDKDGNISRALQCASDGIWTAKDRSGALGQWEPADLGHIISKIGGSE